MMKRLPALLIALLAIVSCKEQTGPTRVPVDLVNRIVAGEDVNRTLISSYDIKQTNADIYVVGSPQRAMDLSRHLAACDVFDNVDGSARPDGLPDFSGEVIAVVYDDANAPYSGYIEAGNYDFLREHVVRLTLDAIDPVCHVSAYDLAGVGRKPSAKLVVLADPIFATCGKFDVDTLFKSLNVANPVLSGLEDAVLKIRETHPNGMVGIISDRPAVRDTMLLDNTVIFANEGSDTPLSSFLDKYLEAGYTKPLGAILIDDTSLNVADIAAAKDSLSSVMNESYLVYGKLFERNFDVVDVVDVITAKCFKQLRDRNVFTHKIAYPVIKEYHTVLKPEFETVDLYNRPAGENKSTYFISADVQE